MPESRHRRRRGRALPRSARSAGTLATSKPRKKKVNKLYLGASALIAVLVIAGFAVGGLGGGGGRANIDTGSASQFVEGIGVQQPISTANHVPEGQPVEYASFPPTSGDHWGTPTGCGIYEEGLPDERIVHNLEHGNIVVSYNLTTEAEVDQLKDVIDDIGLANTWGITRFYDQIPAGQIALAGWGVVDTMDVIDPERIRDFFETYSGGLGPETVSCFGLPQQHGGMSQ